jgi:hypothetical protein
MSKASGFPLEFIPVKTGAGMTFLEVDLRFSLDFQPHSFYPLDPFNFLERPDHFIEVI